MTQFGSDENEHPPPQDYCREQGSFCRGLSVTCFSGWRGHAYNRSRNQARQPHQWNILRSNAVASTALITFLRTIKLISSISSEWGSASNALVSGTASPVNSAIHDCNPILCSGLT